MDLSKKHVPRDETEVEACLQTPDSLPWLLQAALVARLSSITGLYSLLLLLFLPYLSLHCATLQKTDTIFLNLRCSKSTFNSLCLPVKGKKQESLKN